MDEIKLTTLKLKQRDTTILLNRVIQQLGSDYLYFLRKFDYYSKKQKQLTRAFRNERRKNDNHSSFIIQISFIFLFLVFFSCFSRYYQK